MKCIIVIRGVDQQFYNYLRADLTQQLLERGVPEADLPLFALLPSDLAEIEVIWLDEQMDFAKYQAALQMQQYDPDWDNKLADFEATQKEMLRKNFPGVFNE